MTSNWCVFGLIWDAAARPPVKYVAVVVDWPNNGVSVDGGVNDRDGMLKDVHSRQKGWYKENDRGNGSHLGLDLTLLSRCCRLFAGCAVVGYRRCESSCRSVMVAARRGGLGCDVGVAVSSSRSP